jgi:ubiquinone/menaquinone biosynthesis C-methylase UbiE
MADKLANTGRSYGFLWDKHGISPPESWHVDKMQEVIEEPIVQGSIGIDIGSGCGYDSYIMASRNPSVGIISIDLSDGIYRAKKLTSGLKNVRTVKCSVLDMPFKNDVFDFAYSFGVLHHTPDPARALLGMNRVLKKRCPAFLYLYEDHSENLFKFVSLKIVTKLRSITTRMPHMILYILSWICSPVVFVFFSLPTKILRLFKSTEKFAANIPFNFGTGLFSLWGDLYDRFSAPIEYRFNKEQVYSLMKACNFSDITVKKLHDTAGWVVFGYKA